MCVCERVYKKENMQTFKRKDTWWKGRREEDGGERRLEVTGSERGEKNEG